jgi:hypothetical protein
VKGHVRDLSYSDTYSPPCDTLIISCDIEDGRWGDDVTICSKNDASLDDNSVESVRRCRAVSAAAAAAHVYTLLRRNYNLTGKLRCWQVDLEDGVGVHVTELAYLLRVHWETESYTLAVLHRGLISHHPVTAPSPSPPHIKPSSTTMQFQRIAAVLVSLSSCPFKTKLFWLSCYNYARYLVFQ